MRRPSSDEARSRPYAKYASSWQLRSSEFLMSCRYFHAISIESNHRHWKLLYMKHWYANNIPQQISLKLKFHSVCNRVICSLIVAVSYNQPRFCSNASWNPNATTLANTSIVGVIPHAIFVNTMNTVFVANRDNGRILMWFNGSLTVTSTILANVTTPAALFVTADDQIFLDNQLPIAQVDRWTLNQTKLPSPATFGTYCSALFADMNNNLYCSQENQHQVLRKSLSSGMNPMVVIAGIGCAGLLPYMLNYPKGIFVTVNMDLYVADSGNNRIQLFRSGEINATTLAGAGSNGTISLNSPTGVVVDGDGYIFIADENSHRIVGSDRNGFRCVVGCSGSGGTASNQLYLPHSLSFDTNGNMFVADRGNDRIQKFRLSSSLCSK